MVIRTLITSILVFLSIQTFGQNSFSGNIYRSAGLVANSKLEVFDANYGAQLTYQFQWKQLSWNTGVDIRVIDWGNQAGIFIGNNWNLFQKGKSNVSVDYKLLFNVPLFYDQILLGYGASSTFNYEINVFKSYDLGIGLGIRYDTVPGYRNYGPITSTIEMPITFSIKKNLGKKE